MKVLIKLTSNYSSRVVCLLVVAFSILIACNPTESYPPGCKYYHPVESVIELLDNLECSYHYININEYVRCFRSDFEFNYMSNGDTLSWGFDTEQQIHQSMFNQIDEVWLFGLYDSEQYPWSGDTTGATLVLPRDYYLRVFIGPDDSTGTPAWGTAHFICRQDSMDEWYIWQWWDYPDSLRDGCWSDLKGLFMSPPTNH